MPRIEKPGGYQLRILGNKTGTNKKGGQWVLLDAVDDQSGDDTKLMFGLPNEGVDSEKAFEIKTKIWNEFVENCGVNPKQELEDIVAELSGKQVKCVLRLKEKVIFGKEDGKPLIVKNIEYYYSSSMDKQLKFNHDKLDAKLTDWESNFYNTKLKEWEAANPQQSQPEQQDEGGMADIPMPSADPDDDDDLPF